MGIQPSTAKKIEKAKTLIASGKSREKSARAVGLANATLLKYLGYSSDARSTARKRNVRRTKKTRVFTVPTPEAKTLSGPRVFFISGSPADVLEVMRGMS